MTVSCLQPAVEAFFLVHSSSTTSRERHRNTNTENREVVPDLAPVSPIYSDNEGTSQTEAGTNTSWDSTITAQKTLPPDQLKFLKFAGTVFICIHMFLYTRFMYKNFIVSYLLFSFFFFLYISYYFRNAQNGTESNSTTNNHPFSRWSIFGLG